MKNDPDLIYEYVYDNIATLPEYGSLKGPVGALIDGKGTAADQAELMVALLQQAALSNSAITSPSIQAGIVWLTPAQTTAWLGSDNSDNSIARAFNAGGAPTFVVSDTGYGQCTSLNWFWVQVKIGGTTYQFDPASKLSNEASTDLSTEQHNCQSGVALPTVVHSYARTAGVNLTTATGYTSGSTTFLGTGAGGAEQGATITGSANMPLTVKTLNRTNIRASLTTYSNTLVSWIRGNKPAASTTDIIGGASVSPLAIGTQVRQTSLPYQYAGASVTNLTSLTSAYRSTLTLTLCPSSTGACTATTSNTATLNSSDIYGHRLAVFTNSANKAALTLDGAAVTANDGSTAMVGAIATLGTAQPIFVSIQHPFYSAAQTGFLYITLGNPYVIQTAWGPTSRGMIEKHRKLLLENQQAAPTTPSAESELGESLAVLGYTWTAELSRAAEVTGQISSVELQYHHAVGVVGMRAFDASGNGAPYVDLPQNLFGVAQLVANPASSGATPTETAAFMTSIKIGSVLESGTLEQASGTPGGVSNQVAVSTIKLLDTAISNSDTIYDINNSANSGAAPGNWTGTLKTSFSSNYLLGDYTRIDCFVNPTDSGCPVPAGASQRVIAAGNGKQVVGTLGSGGFQGAGYITLTADNSGVGAIITGGLSGGIATITLNSSDQDIETAITQAVYGAASGVATTYSNAVGDAGGSAVINGTLTYDPINRVSGAFTNDHTDLSVGSADMPYGLSFARHYDSASRLASSVMGAGWTHNWTYSANADSDGFAGMGQDSPISGASAIAAIYVLQDILNTSHYTTQPAGVVAVPLDHILTGVVTERWLMDQLTGNIVEVVQPGRADEFVKLADGTYNSPLKTNASLTLASGVYKLTTADQNVLSFNTAGNIATLHYAAGPTITFTYNGSNQLASVTNGMGRSLTLSYTSNRVTGVTDGVRSISFGYDTSGNLTSFTDPLSQQVTYNYDQPGRLTRIYYPSFPTNAFISNTYDSLDRVETQADANGNTTSLYLAGSRSEGDDPAGTKDILYLNARGDTTTHIDGLGYTTTNVYDDIDRLSSTTLPEGNGVTYVYDDAHGMSAQQNVLSVTANPKPLSGLTAITISFTYDATFQKVKTATDGKGNVTTNIYDTAGGTGNLLEVDQPTVGGVTPKTIFTYSSRGQVLTKTDPVGKITKMVYDATTEELSSVTDDFGTGHFNLLTQFAYDGSAFDGATADAIGNVTSTIDPNGNVTTSNYDALRRVTQVTAPTATGAVTKTTYYPDGLVAQVQRATGNVSAPWQTSSSTWSFSGKKLTDTDPNSHVTTYTYDNLDRVATVTDAVSRVTTFAYDALGRQLSATNTGVQAAPLSAASYTPNGQKATFTDANHNTTTYLYDGFDRAFEMQYPTTGVPGGGSSNTSDYEAVTSYDANGNPLTMRRRDGTVITLTFDVLNRPTQKTYSAGGTATFYSYDLDGRPLSALYTSTSGPGVTYAYDTAGRVSSETSSTASQSHTISFQYDANGNRTRETWPDALYVTYAYDVLNRMTAVEENGATSGLGLLASYSYDPLSERTGITRGNGTTTTYGYDAASRLTSLAHVVPSDTGHATTFGFGYTNANQLNSWSNTNVSYDWTNHAVGTVSKTYDGLNRDLTIVPISGGYDTKGNVTADGARTFTYDADNKMTSVAVAASSTTATLSYDPLDRLQQDSDVISGTPSMTLFLYEGSRLSAEYDGSGNLLRRYVHGPGTDEPIVWYDYTSGPQARIWLHANGQGSIIALSSETGVVTHTFAYGSYGEPQSWGASRFLYTGQIALPEVALYHYKARAYDPIAGRFLQTDPIGYDGGANLYAYVGADPLNLVDPTGNSSAPGSDTNSGTGAPWGGQLIQAADTNQTPLAQARLLAAPFINGYNPNDPNYHAYEAGPTLACAVGYDGCNMQTLNAVTQFNSVPGQLFGSANSGKYNITGLLPGLPNPILNYSPAEGVFINQTLSGHMFDPGRVVTLTFQNSGNAYVYSVGVGIGANQIFNKFVGPPLFETMQAKIQDMMQQLGNPDLPNGMGRAFP